MRVLASVRTSLSAREEEKMNVSAFQFTDPDLLEVNYEVNREYSGEHEAVEIETNILTRRQYLDDKTSAAVQMKITVGERGNKTPFYIEATYQGNFHWEKGAFDEKTVEAFLQKNAVLVLLSYARPMIAQITGASGYPAFHVPFMNLTEE